jgi:hypothetical protein
MPSGGPADEWHPPWFAPPRIAGDLKQRLSSSLPHSSLSTRSPNPFDPPVPHPLTENDSDQFNAKVCKIDHTALVASYYDAICQHDPLCALTAGTE